MKKYEPSFILKNSPGKSKAARTLTALTYGGLTGEILGNCIGPLSASTISWLIPVFDGFYKKSCSKKDFGDYIKFKVAAIAMNLEPAHDIIDFISNKYAELQPHLESYINLINNL